MTPYYVTGAFCLASLLSFFLGRHTMAREVEDYFDELTTKAKNAALFQQGDVQK